MLNAAAASEVSLTRGCLNASGRRPAAAPCQPTLHAAAPKYHVWYHSDRVWPPPQRGRVQAALAFTSCPSFWRPRPSSCRARRSADPAAPAGASARGTCAGAPRNRLANAGCNPQSKGQGTCAAWEACYASSPTTHLEPAPRRLNLDRRAQPPHGVGGLALHRLSSVVRRLVPLSLCMEIVCVHVSGCRRLRPHAPSYRQPPHQRCAQLVLLG